MPPEVEVLKDFLMMKVWCKNINFEPRISSQVDKLDNHFGTKKLRGRTIILGRRKYLVYSQESNVYYSQNIRKQHIEALLSCSVIITSIKSWWFVNNITKQLHDGLCPKSS